MRAPRWIAGSSNGICATMAVLSGCVAGELLMSTDTSCEIETFYNFLGQQIEQGALDMSPMEFMTILATS